MTVHIELVATEESTTTVRATITGVRLPLTIKVFSDGSRTVVDGPKWAIDKAIPNAAAKSSFREAVGRVRDGEPNVTYLA